jgi:hypothetical protein
MQLPLAAALPVEQPPASRVLKNMCQMCVCTLLQVFTDVDINLAPSAQLQPDAANGAATTDAAEGSSGPANGVGPEAPAANGSTEPPTAAEPTANGSSSAASDPEDWSNSQMLSLVGAMKKHGKVIWRTTLQFACLKRACTAAAWCGTSDGSSVRH